MENQDHRMGIRGYGSEDTKPRYLGRLNRAKESEGFAHLWKGVFGRLRRPRESEDPRMESVDGIRENGIR